MKKHNKPAASAQAPAVENQELFMTLLRDSLRTVAEQMLMAEVAALCGPSHFPQPDAIYRRAGSERGTCHAGGRGEAILRPRVRKQVGDGTEAEHALASYAAMRRPGNNAAAVVTALAAGMSTRSQEWASEGDEQVGGLPGIGSRPRRPRSPSCANAICAKWFSSGSCSLECISGVALTAAQQVHRRSVRKPIVAPSDRNQKWDDPRGVRENRRGGVFV